jgi:hypothetical protein
MLQLLTYMISFGEINVLIELSRIDLFGASRVYLQLETTKFQEVFLSKMNISPP